MSAAKKDSISLFHIDVYATSNVTLVTDSEEDDDKPNPYSSYQQFHRELSTHDDPKAALNEFETLEQGECLCVAIVTTGDAY